MNKFALGYMYFDDAAGYRRGDFDGGFVGFDFHQWIVFANRLPCLHVHANDLTFMDTLGEIGQLELIHRRGHFD